jgi:DNA-binding NarL/FixJ family response regulator
MTYITPKCFFLKNLFLSAVLDKTRFQTKAVQAMIRIVIIDEKDSERKDTEKILAAQTDFTVVATGKDGYEAVRLADTHQPDVMLLEINLSYLDGVKAASILDSRHPRMTVIILTRLEDPRCIQNAVTNGVSGYLIKNKDTEKLADMIRVIHNSGCLIFPRSVLGSDQEELKTSPQFLLNLSRIELQIVRHIGEGMENQEIAEKMRLKLGTIRNHITAILQKTTLRNRTQLAIFAVQNGLAKEVPVA